MTDREIFRKNFAELMQASKVTQVDIAKATGIKQQTISAWICGRGYPRADSLTKLCQFFHIRMADLVRDIDAAENDEDRIINIFRSLSAEGKQKMIERAEEMKTLYPLGRKKHGKA